VAFIVIMLVFQLLLPLSSTISNNLFWQLLNRLNSTFIHLLRLIGVKVSIEKPERLSAYASLVIISNHQSMFDIPFIFEAFRDYRPRFIAKKELAGWIPSVSFALRKMGSLIIDRDQPGDALTAIVRYATKMSETGGTLCIFPEGTRARDGVIKNFKTRGLEALAEKLPQAIFIPIAISDSWKIVRHKMLKIEDGIHVQLKVLPILNIDEIKRKNSSLAECAEEIIKKQVAI
jgi:1-acyl-sn-glycerol-3-phosphate acyltransferase